MRLNWIATLLALAAGGGLFLAACGAAGEADLCERAIAHAARMHGLPQHDWFCVSETARGSDAIVVVQTASGLRGQVVFEGAR